MYLKRWQLATAASVATILVAGTSYLLGFQVGTSRRGDRQTLQELDRKSPRLARLIRHRLQPETAYIGLASLPCLVGFKQRHPEETSVRGTVDFLIRTEADVARIEDARPAEGNVDAELARCVRDTWEWTTASYPVSEAITPVWLSLPLALALPARYPPLPPGWEQPARWRSAQASELPPGWASLVAPDLAIRSRIRRAAALPADGSMVISHPLELRRLLPVFAEELHEAVFSATAAARFNATVCAPGGQSSAGSGEVLQIQISVAGGTARVRSLGLDGAGPDSSLERCLLAKIGIEPGEYKVPGEADREVLVRWPVRLPPASRPPTLVVSSPVAIG